MTAGDTISMRQKKMLYRAWHRGTLEMDLVLGPFADRNIPIMSETDLDRLEKLMDEQDIDLWKWVMGHTTPPDDIDLEMLALVATDHQARMSAK